MQLLNLQHTLSFMKYRRIAMFISLILFIVSCVSFAVRGIDWGLDFTGGTLVEIGFQEAASVEPVRQQLIDNGFTEATVQHFGSSKDILVRLPPQTENAQTVGDRVVGALSAMGKDIQIRRIEFVGPSVGDELREQGGLAMLTALICILMYVAFRFEWRFAAGSVIALIHDVTITLGIFSLLGLEFDLTVLAALLAVIGYSLNDTIVVSDRIRENFRKIRKSNAEEVINISLTQTLSRTIITSLTTLLVLVALFFLGGSLIHGFATALLFGVFVGTYSSVYVASSIGLALGISKEDMIPEVIEKEGSDLDSLP